MHVSEDDMKQQVQLLHARAKKATMNYGYPANEQLPHNVEDSSQILAMMFANVDSDMYFDPKVNFRISNRSSKFHEIQLLDFNLFLPGVFYAFVTWKVFWYRDMFEDPCLRLNFFVNQLRSTMSYTVLHLTDATWPETVLECT